MKTRILTAALLVCVLAFGMLVPATAQSPVSEFDTILAEKLILTDSITVPNQTASGDVTVGDDLTVSGDAAVTGDVTVTGDVSAADITASDDITATGALVAGTAAITGAATAGSFSTSAGMAAGKYNIAEGADLTVTSGGTITLTNSLHALTSAGNVWSSSITGGSNGMVAVLYNSAANTITISDTGNLKLAGDFAMGQTDTLTLFYRNPNWYELARVNN